jgi:hypothetical protein
MDFIAYRETMDLDYAVAMQREGGVTLSLASNGGEVEGIARNLLHVSTGDAIKFLNEENLEIKDRFPGEFAAMANAHALDESCLPRSLPATAPALIAPFLDSPKAEWLWEYAEANDLVVHVHPPMVALGSEALMQYRLNEAIGRPFDSAVNVARMIGSGVFDRHPNLQVLVVHMGGGLPSILGRLDFNWHLNYNGVPNPPAGRPYTNLRTPSDYVKTNILVDCMGFSPLGLRAAIEMCGIDRWCSAPTSAQCHTASRSTCRSSKTWCRARLSATWCSGRPATEYSGSDSTRRTCSTTSPQRSEPRRKPTGGAPSIEVSSRERSSRQTGWPLSSQQARSSVVY